MSRRPDLPLADETCLTKEVLIDAIVGVGFPSINVAMKAVKAELARFTGNQHNESWEWRRDMLAQAHIDDLHDLYLTLRGGGREKAHIHAH